MKNKVRITDHAIVRFLERVKKINREEFEKEILTDQMKNCINVLGSGEFPIQNGKFKAIVKNGIVVTIQ